MKICKNCNIEFKPVGCETCCTIKCRLLYGIKKENDCWIWQGGTAGQYGKIQMNKKTYSAHRSSYLIFKGDIPAGKWVCHLCDIPLCINPDHLWLGSASENRLDSFKKKRSEYAKGENSHFSKYTDDQIKEIRKLKDEGFTYSRLKRIFNCSYTHILNIIKNKNRKDSI